MTNNMLNWIAGFIAVTALAKGGVPAMQTYDPDPATAGEEWNILLRNAVEDNQGGSGSTLPLKANTNYEFQIHLPNDAVVRTPGKRRWVIIYRNTQPSNANCESTHCYTRIKLFSSADTGYATAWRYKPQQNERILVTLWSPSADATRSGEADTEWRVDRATLSNNRRGSRVRFTASARAFVPNAVSDVYVVKTP
jgi:hypothetical protein